MDIVRQFWQRHQAKIILAFIGVTVFYRMLANLRGVTFFAFQTRDLDRAAEVAAGHLILWGPELTGGGNLPGGLYYWLMAIPLKLGTDWTGGWTVIALLWSMGVTVMFGFVWRWAGLYAALLGYIWFVPSPIYTNFLNQSASPFFMTVGLCALVQAFAGEKDERRKCAWWISCLAIGFALQLHFSGIVIFISGLLAQAAGPRLKLRRLPARDFAAGFAALMAPLLPYLAFMTASRFGVALGLPAPAYSGDPSEAMPAILYLAGNFLSDLSFTEIGLKILLLTPLPLVFAARGLWRTKDPVKIRLRNVLLLCAAVSAVPASYYLVRPNGLRYIIPLALSMTALSGVAFTTVTESRRKMWIFIGLCVAAGAILFFAMPEELVTRKIVKGVISLAICGLVAGFAANPFEPLKIAATLFAIALMTVQTIFVHSDHGVPQLPLMTVRHMRLMSRVILDRTEWDYSHARERIFFVNMQMGTSPQYVYEEVAAKRIEFGRKMTAPDDPPDGFIVTTGMRPDSEDGFEEWLGRQNVQKDLREGLADGGIEFEDIQQRDDMIVASYRVKDRLKYPAHFNNIGYPYTTHASNAILEGREGKSGAVKISEDEALFYWNECPDSWCASGIHVRFAQVGGKIALHANILGSPLEQISEWTGPGWAQTWIGPSLRVNCGGKTSEVTLVSSVGINVDYVLRVSGMNQAYNSFLAPLERSAELPCAGPLKEIRAAQKEFRVFGMNGIRRWDAPEAALEF